MIVPFVFNIEHSDSACCGPRPILRSTQLPDWIDRPVHFKAPAYRIEQKRTQIRIVLGWLKREMHHGQGAATIHPLAQPGAFPTRNMFLQTIRIEDDEVRPLESGYVARPSQGNLC
jgi:hypothetical protein